MNYKIILYNDKFYKEIKLEEGFKKGLLIGTGNECQLRFFREQFFTDFVIRMVPEGEKWIATCEDSVYLKKDNAYKTYIQQLEPQDVVSVCYDVSDTELFKIEFSIDFHMGSTDYDRQIVLDNLSELVIGGKWSSTIQIQDELLADDYISMKKANDGYRISQENMKYNITVNGFQERSRMVQVKNQDFFALNGYSFYLKDSILYTSKEYPVFTQLSSRIIRQQINHLQYPRFIRSARQQFEIPEEKLEILPPKRKPEESKKNLVMTMVPLMISMGMMIMMRMAMGSNRAFAVMYACMGLVSVVMAVVNYRNESTLYKKNLVKRENDYNRYLAEQEEKIRSIREKEKLIAGQKYPSLEEHMQFVENFDARLFEKLKTHEDYMSMRIGEGVVESKNQIIFKPQEYREVDDPFMDYPEKIHEKYQYIEQMPVILELKEKAAVGFVGDRAHLYQMVKNLILLIATEHYYQDMKLFLLMQKEDASYFYWARWIRNMSENGVIRNFAYDEASNKVVLEYLYSELCNREKLNKDEIEKMPVYIVLVYRSEVIGNHPLSQYVEKAAELGFCFLFFEEYAEKLNQYCAKRVFLHSSQNSGYIQDILNGEEVQTFQYPHIPGSRAAEAAVKLGCVYVDEVSLEASLTKNITLYELLGIMNAYDLEIEKRWASSKVYASMAAPLGVKSGGEVVSLDLHEKYHGPHGLVAGTTGSGKSEIMQSYILSMATLFHPYEVGFIIIDFKGGGMVNQFRDLPHLNGAITNIDDGEINRSLSSIKAELKKRQRLFAEYDVNHIDDYIRLYKEGKAKTPLPHLVLIVDEFAELKSEQPEFMKELISAARIGRSLGVHLILATQKPSGVVNDQIWSNSKFKLCLKVQNKSDSNEVLKSPLAAEIREPGRAYLQVGNNEIFQLFQSAYSGAPIPNSTIENQKSFQISRVNMYGGREVIFEQKRETDEKNITQLDALVDYIREYCEKKQIKRLPNICLPALDEKLPYGLLKYQCEGSDIRVPVGMYDDPENQWQDVKDVNFTQGHIMVIGSSQFGKTNLLQTFVRGLAERYSSDMVHIYILDFASMIMRNFSKLNHVGEVMTSGDDEKLETFFKMMVEELGKRKSVLSELGLSSYSAYLEAGKQDLPQIVIMIDNMLALREIYPAQESNLLKLAREGAAVGICMVAAAQQTSGLGYKYLSNFPQRIALYCNESSEYAGLFERCRMKLKPIQGRGIVSIDKKFYEAQTYLAFPAEREIDKVKEIAAFIQEENSKDRGKGAVKVQSVPDILTDEEIYKVLGRRQPYTVPLGMNCANMDMDVIDVTQFPVLGIVGATGMGRTNYLCYLVQKLLQNKEKEPVNIRIIDDKRKRLQIFEKHITLYSTSQTDIVKMIGEVYSTLQRRYEKGENGEGALNAQEPLECIVLNAKEVYEVINDSEELTKQCMEILTTYSNMKICMILSDLPNMTLQAQTSQFMKLLKSNMNLLMFQQLKEQKVTEIPSVIQKRYQKPLVPGEAYFKFGSYFGKYRTPYFEFDKRL